ncbi:MAG: SBBP repeat-containing protein, partial [Deltaproteobacteria bacterium]|nr:SBBP repeat-containing protein [Deltaproteobacteria bacterium]
CEAGGKKIETGLDADGNNILDNTEVQDVSYVCNGVEGEDGNVYDVLVDVTDEPLCSNPDGQRLNTGFDLNDNGILDLSEITSIDFINCPEGAPEILVQWGTASNDYTESVAVDSDGNVYVTGYTSSVLYGSSSGSYDAFVTKFDSSGTEVWGKQ